VNPILALSTAWCSARHQDGEAMLEEMAGLGFEYVELSHGIRITLVPGILNALTQGVVKVGSVHNFCPLPAGVDHAAPNLFEPSASATHGHEQEQWLRHSRRSLDFAAQVGARAMVVHLGSVRFFWLNPARRLRNYVRGHPGASPATDPAYQKLLAKTVARIARRGRPFWDQTTRSIDQLLPYAAKKGVRLGLENRERIEELPADTDFPDFLKNLSLPDQGGYWHDAGHAELKERMGVVTQRRLLEENAERLLGFHLHDVSKDGFDHQPVGTGSIDFKMVSRFWKPHHLLVLELSPRVKTADVVTSRKRIEDLIAACP
jgi:sugar phosphate isomerase/epimerase